MEDIILKLKGELAPLLPTSQTFVRGSSPLAVVRHSSQFVRRRRRKHIVQPTSPQPKLSEVTGSPTGIQFPKLPTTKYE
ncbi:hypothetical protein ACS0TY_014011 [Phlomoides rotata]